MFDFYASQVHYAEHLVPVYFALPADLRGRFFAPVRVAAFLETEGIVAPQSAPSLDTVPIVVAGIGDSRRCIGRQVALLDHGVGQTYEGLDDPSYAGSRGRDKISLFLAPSERVADLDRERNPNARAEVVGCPKMDGWFPKADGWFREHRERLEKPTVAVSSHWDCTLVPETRWAFPAFKDQIASLARRTDIDVIGHAHPRSLARLRGFYESIGIEVVARFDRVLVRADVYVVDNSSTLYEMAAAGIPTVALDAPWYRRNVEHGLRFWSEIPGLRCPHNRSLSEVVSFALEDLVPLVERRQAVTERVYGRREGCAQAAAYALTTHFGADSDKPKRLQRKRPVPAPRLPIQRLRRVGARVGSMMEVTERWGDMDSIEKSEELRRLANMTDEELRVEVSDMEMANG